MSNYSPQKRFEEALLKLSRAQSKWTAFSDFLDFSLLFIRWWDVKASDFADLEKKYPEREQQQLFAEAYVAMADTADHDGTGFKDPFGDFFMEHLSNDRTGQFFTPEEVCELIAGIQIGDILPDNATVGDPCCGSGRLLLAAAKMNRKALFYGADIDITCCKMTVLNFMLNTMCGEVKCMNTLSLEHFKTWRIGKVMDGAGYYRPWYTETEFSQSSKFFHTTSNPIPPAISQLPGDQNRIAKNKKPHNPSQLIINF